MMINLHEIFTRGS